MKQLEVKASSVEDAIEKGITELGVTREDIEFEVLENGGFLKKAKVLIKVKETSGQKAVNFLDGLFSRMGITVNIALEEKDDKAEINVSGQDSGAVIGYRGDVLDAIQYITSLAVNKEDTDYKKIVIDCENYRSKREITLASLAGKLADKAVRTGRKVFLEPMNPFERRVIHSTLQEHAEVTTSSEGFDPNRFVIITPKNLRADTHDSGRRFGNNRNDNRNDNRSDNRGEGRGEGRPQSQGSRDGFRRDDRQNDRGERKDGDRSQNSGFKSNSQSAPRKTSSFSSFGTYLGNSKSGFTKDTDFTKKSGFDNLKD